MKTKYWLLLVLIASAASFFWGRSTIKTKEIVRYVRGETVYGEYPSHLLIPVREIKGDLKIIPKYFFLRDTIVVNNTEYITEKVDTAKIIEDFITKKEYRLTLFDSDTLGKLDLGVDVQFNRLTSLDYQFMPVHKEVIIYRKPKLEPFLSVGFGTLNIGSIGGGVFYKDIGVEYDYQSDFKNGMTGHAFNFIYRF